jgi:hypothetical protein
MFGQDGEDEQAMADAVRSIVAAVTSLIETLSLEDEAEQNLSTFRILTMETDDDVEIAARFVFLDLVSQRVVAHKPANQRWIATTRRLDRVICRRPLHATRSRSNKTTLIRRVRPVYSLFLRSTMMALPRSGIGGGCCAPRCGV